MAETLKLKFKKGSVVRDRVTVGEFSDGSPVAVPLVTVAGKSEGPTLYVQAGIHGDELTGITICQQVLRQLDPASLTGRLVAVPVVNLPAYLTRTRGFLHEERWLVDMNRNWPGDPQGLLTMRIASQIFSSIIRQVTFTIDLHSALDGCDIVPFCYVQPDDNSGGTLEVRERHALAFGTPYVYYHSAATKFGTSNMSQSIAYQADPLGLPVISAEMGESRRISWNFVPIGVRGVFNVMKTMGMLPGKPESDGTPRRFTKFVNVHAERGGGLRVAVDLGDEVTAGQQLATIVDAFGDTAEVIESPVDGFVQRIMRLGSVASGAEIAWIGH